MSPQIVLMTGSSSGIGLATAKRLALDQNQRYIVVATVISLTEKDDLEAAVGTALDKTVFIHKLDVTKDEDIDTVVDATLKKFGRIDVLINVAGFAFSDIAERVTRERMEQIFNVNVFGTIRLTQAVIPNMKNRKAGRILTVSSVAGKIGWPYCEFYCSTKFALEGFFEGLAIALRSFGIRVCLIEPGKSSTALITGLFNDFKVGSNDESVDDIDRRQFRGLDDSTKAMAGSTADEVAEAITTRCLDVDEPVFRHLLPVQFHDVVRAGASDITENDTKSHTLSGHVHIDIMAPQIVFMTGCSSGIGLATAKRLALDPDRRFVVIATVIALSEKTDLEAAVGNALSKTIFTVELDITRSNDITAIVERTLKTHERIDILINIAGIGFIDIPEMVPGDLMNKIFDVNVLGTIRLTQAVLPHMKQRKTGKIITITSIAGKMSYPYMEMYSSTKFALEGFFEGLTVALRSFDIRVCLVEPGGTDTNLIDSFKNSLDNRLQDESIDGIDRRQLEHLRGSIAASVTSTPDDIAEAIVARCLDVDEPVFCHLLPEKVHQPLKAAASDLTGETKVAFLSKRIGK